MDCDSFALSIRFQKKDNDSKNLGHLFPFCNLDKNHEIFRKKVKKVVVKIKIETPNNIWKDEFNSLGSKAYSFESIDKNTNKLKSISKSHQKKLKFKNNIIAYLDIN